MAEEKIINESKQENQSQDKPADERLTKGELDKVAGGLIPDPGDIMEHGETSGK